MTRPGWDDYFLGIAAAVSARGDCTRRQVGAVLVDPETHDIIQPGYNGVPAGAPGCLEGACPRGRHYGRYSGATFDLECGCGGPWPCPDAVPPGSSYDTGPGTCIGIHAEANVLIRAGKLSRGAYLYVTDKPCDGCMKLIKGAGIKHVFWPEDHWVNPL